jgi:hypothetical protein
MSVNLKLKRIEELCAQKKREKDGMEEILLLESSKCILFVYFYITLK